MGNRAVHRVFSGSLEIIETIPKSTDFSCNRPIQVCAFDLTLAKIEISTDIEVTEFYIEEVELD